MHKFFNKFTIAKFIFTHFFVLSFRGKIVLQCFYCNLHLKITKTKSGIIAIAILVLLQSCSGISKDLKKQIDCSRAQQDLALRYSLFDKLDDDEIKRRQKITVPTVDYLDHLSVFSEIVQQVQQAPDDSKMIAVDLRHYKNVELGNIVIANFPNNELLDFFLINSKYSQGFFALINFNSDSVTLFAPKTYPVFPNSEIRRGDLREVEIVINVSDSGHIHGNMKFSPNQKVSIIADRIAKPYRLDLRENSNLQFHLNNKWIMPVYSISGSRIEGGKDTAGFYKVVNNRNNKGIKLHKFDKSFVACYTDQSAPKF